MRVYLDYAATSPIKPEVKKAIIPFLGDNFGNPSSIHSWGRAALEAVESSRSKVANFLGCKESEIFFTSGGTEADNLAIKGLILPFVYQGKEKPHIITSQIEHHAVLKTCQQLEKVGVEVTYLKPNREGIIEVKEIKEAIKPNTRLVSIMYVNNEIGTVQPIKEIGEILEEENTKRIQSKGALKPIYFHTDAVQAIEYFPANVKELQVDMLTFSGHKIGAIKGIGVLYVSKNVPLVPMIHGGSQEGGLRAGTENLLGIVAIGKAIEVLRNEKREMRKENTIELRNYFIDQVINEIPEVELNGSKTDRSPNNANFYFKYVEGESIVLNLDIVGIAASSGSACMSKSLEPSHVITSVYDSAERAHGSIRFTLGESTTKEEIDYTIENLKTIIARLRAISPLYKLKKDK